MKKVSIKLRLTLNRLRKVQRDRQLEIEARLKNVENIVSKYCQICKLYFRQSKIEHRDSDDHKKIRNFLKPYCKVKRKVEGKEKWRRFEKFSCNILSMHRFAMFSC